MFEPVEKGLDGIYSRTMATSRPVIPPGKHVHWPCRRMIYLHTTAYIDRDNGVAFIHLHLLASIGTISRSRHRCIWHVSSGVADLQPRYLPSHRAAGRRQPTRNHMRTWQCRRLYSVARTTRRRGGSTADCYVTYEPRPHLYNAVRKFQFRLHVRDTIRWCRLSVRIYQMKKIEPCQISAEMQKIWR